MNEQYRRRLESGSEQIRMAKIKTGRAIAAQLTEVRDQLTVAKMLGISRQSVDFVEAGALSKIRARLLNTQTTNQRE